MYEKRTHENGRHGRTHRVDKLAPVGEMLGMVKKLAKHRHKKKTRQFNKSICRDGWDVV